MDDVANFLHDECERVMGAEGGSYTMEPVAVYGLALSEILALRIQVTSQAEQLKAADALADACAQGKPRGASILTPDRLRLRGVMQGNRSREAMDRYVATHMALMGRGS